MQERALRVLEFLGVTTVSPRNGISINQPNDRDGYLPLLYTLAFEKTTARELFEVRRALQLEMVAIAAEHHTQEDLDALRALIEQMRSDPDASAEEFARLDYLFFRDNHMASSAQDHRTIIDSFRIRDPFGAELAMKNNWNYSMLAVEASASAYEYEH